MINKERMSKKAAAFEIELSQTQLEQLDIYARMLVKWNEIMNLTAITEPEEIETKHFLDCILTADLYNDDDSVADVGTGAGFPGMVLKIMRPNMRITLIDSLEKRLNFLNNVASELGLKIKCIHGRAEDVGHEDGLRESFTVTTARAVASMNMLAEFCLPLTMVGGRMVAMKGKTADDELKLAENALNILGGTIESERSLILPDNSERQIIVVKKSFATPEKYPRRAPAIKKKPL